MSLIYMDGWDAYGTADLARRWTVASSNPADFTVDATGGRNGTGALKIATYDNRSIQRFLGANRPTVVLGFAFKFSALPPLGSSTRIVTLLDTNSYQVSLGVDGNGQLLLNRGGAHNNMGTNLATYNAGLLANVFYYLELKVTIVPSIAAGSCQVYLNGSKVIEPAAGTSTRNTGNSYVTNIQFGGLNAGGAVALNAWFDDLYILDDQGASNNAPLGDIRVEAIRPTGAGSSSQFTPVGAANNWDCVDDATQDDDTTYVSTNTVGNRDLYALGDLASSPSSIKAIQVVTLARKDDAGNRVICSSLRSGGATYDGANQFSLADGYTLFVDPWDLDPNGNVPWTGAAVNALEAGVKLAG